MTVLLGWGMPMAAQGKWGQSQWSWHRLVDRTLFESGNSVVTKSHAVSVHKEEVSEGVSRWQYTLMPHPSWQELPPDPIGLEFQLGVLDSIGSSA